MFVCAIGGILPYNSFTKTVYHDNHQDFFSMRISLYQNMPKMIVTVMQTRSITSKQIAQFVVLLEHLTRNSGGRTPLPLPGFEFQSGQVYHSFSYIPFSAVKPTHQPPTPPPRNWQLNFWSCQGKEAGWGRRSFKWGGIDSHNGSIPSTWYLNW